MQNFEAKLLLSTEESSVRVADVERVAEAKPHREGHGDERTRGDTGCIPADANLAP